MKGMLIADIDVHVHELPQELANFCEMPWKRSLLAIKDIPERYLDIPGLSPGGQGYDPVFPGGQPIRMVKSVAKMRKELSYLGIDLAILFPDHLLTLALYTNPDYAMAVSRAYNRWIADKWLGKGKGLYGAICTAPQDPVASAEEIKQVGKNKDFACIYLPTAGVYPLYGDRKYDPVFAVAERMDLPVVLHSVGTVHPVFPFQLEQFPNEFSRHGIAHPFSMASNVVHIVANGVPAKFPKLKICFAEGAIAWVPWVMMRLDKEYVEHRKEVPFLKERPSRYIRKFRFGTQPIEEPEKGSDYRKLLDLIGDDTCVMFSSDWPHHDFDHPRKIMGFPLSEESKRKIMGENALEFFSRLEVQL